MGDDSGCQSLYPVLLPTIGGARSSSSTSSRLDGRRLLVTLLPPPTTAVYSGLLIFITARDCPAVAGNIALQRAATGGIIMMRLDMTIQRYTGPQTVRL